MKKFCLAILLALSSIAANAQHLKITSVDSQDQTKYQEFAQEHLGKILTLTFYDNALTIQEAKQPTLYLKKVGDDRYVFEVDNTGEHDTMTVDIDYTLGVVTSLTLVAITYNKQGGYTNTVTAVAKRF